MSVHTGGERGHFVGELRQRGGVAFGQLADAPGERLRDAVKFALHGRDQRAQPFVLHHESLDFILGELRVAGGDLFGEGVLRCGQFGGGGGFLLHEGKVFLEAP